MDRNEDGVPFLLVSLNERKYLQEAEGQKYALYQIEEERCACAYTHVRQWIEVYKSLLGRELLPSDPLFPRTDENINTISFGEFMVQATFMKTVNRAVSMCGIVPKNASGHELGKFTAHCFRRGGAQHRFVTGKVRWPLDVVKWWGGWGKSDDMNTIIRYLLEETSKYETSYSHYLYTRGSDSRLFHTNVSTIQDVGRELNALKDTVVQRLAQLEQSSAAHRLLIAENLSETARTIQDSVQKSLQQLRKEMTVRLMSSYSQARNDNIGPPCNETGEAINNDNTTVEIASSPTLN